jgi:hypothetical protein
MFTKLILAVGTLIGCNSSITTEKITQEYYAICSDINSTKCYPISWEVSYILQEQKDALKKIEERVVNLDKKAALCSTEDLKELDTLRTRILERLKELNKLPILEHLPNDQRIAVMQAHIEWLIDQANILGDVKQFSNADKLMQEAEMAKLRLEEFKKEIETSK